MALLVLLRFSIFAVGAAGIVYLVRQRRWTESRGWRGALGTGGWVLLATLISIFGQGAVQTSVLVALAFVPGVCLLATLIGLFAYAGFLLWETNGGWWQRTPSARLPERIGMVLLAVLGLVAINAALFLASEVPAATYQFSVPTFLRELVRSSAFAVSEEVVYRGLLLGLLVTGLKRFRPRIPMAVVVSSLVFMAQHVTPQYQGLMLLSSFAAGGVFSFLFLRYGLLVAIAAHLLANLTITPALARLL